MRFLTLLCTISAVLPAIFAGPIGSPLPVGVQIEVHPGEKAAGGYIVRLQDGVSKADIIGKVTGLSQAITHQYDNIFNGFAGTFDEVTLAALQVFPGVLSIVEDGIFHTTATEPQNNAPWGLARLSSKTSLGSNLDSRALTYTYKYDSKAGEGVDVYIVDTGIRTTHKDFGGRAQWGFTANPTYGNADGNGHGTHCAGTAIGGQFGVAKKASVFAVKVLSDQGSGLVSDIVAGMGYVLLQKTLSERPTVVSMSLGGGANSMMDMATKVLVQNGIHVVVAAGNANEDSDNTSPARVREAITVGASTIKDERAYFSNFGPGVDVFAPGFNVTSAWKDSDTATFVASGTSMATPHVAGFVAYLISVEGNKTPAAMSSRIRELALKGVLSPTTIPTGTDNLLAYNGQ